MKLFQRLINQLREFVDGYYGVMDETGLILGCTDESVIGSIHPSISSIIGNNAVYHEENGQLFQKIYIRNRLEFIVFMNIEGGHSKSLLSMLSVNVMNLRNYHEEKFDKGNFFKNIITDNVLPGDIQFKAKELHIPYNAYRAALLIKTEHVGEIQPYEVIQSLFPKRGKDFVISLDDNKTVLIKELKSPDESAEIDKTAKAVIDTLNTELMVKVQVGIGSIVDNIKDIRRSYMEAQTALHVGSIFESGKEINNYNNLGIGRLIYQLPTTMCKLFLKEVFKGGSLDSLDQETIITIQKFFENNLNVSETSRQLYVHRNTLVYRLDKIQKITGLDLRNFDDAITFRVSMLVKKYLDRAESARSDIE